MPARGERHDETGRPGPIRWSAGARRLGIGSCLTVVVVGGLYLIVIAAWLLIEQTPREPIGDPYLAVMEGLTIVSAFAVVGMMLSILRFACRYRLAAVGAVASATAAAGLTGAVHFVQLTAVRQLWLAGDRADYRLVWPSPIFAVEYFAWDLLMGGAMVLAAAALTGRRRSRAARRAFLVSGMLCVSGASGPLTGLMGLQTLAIAGYAVGLPVAAALTARMYGRRGSGTTGKRNRPAARR